MEKTVARTLEILLITLMLASSFMAFDYAGARGVLQPGQIVDKQLVSIQEMPVTPTKDPEIFINKPSPTVHSLKIKCSDHIGWYPVPRHYFYTADRYPYLPIIETRGAFTNIIYKKDIDYPIKSGGQ